MESHQQQATTTPLWPPILYHKEVDTGFLKISATIFVCAVCMMAARHCSDKFQKQSFIALTCSRNNPSLLWHVPETILHLYLTSGCQTNTIRCQSHSVSLQPWLDWWKSNPQSAVTFTPSAYNCYSQFKTLALTGGSQTHTVSCHTHTISLH